MGCFHPLPKTNLPALCNEGREIHFWTLGYGASSFSLPKRPDVNEEPASVSVVVRHRNATNINNFGGLSQEWVTLNFKVMTHAFWGAVPYTNNFPAWKAHVSSRTVSSPKQYWNKLQDFDDYQHGDLASLPYVISTLFLWKWSLRDGPYFFKANAPLSLMNGPSSFKNGLSAPLSLGA